MHFQALMMKNLRYKYYNKRITTRDNGNVKFHDQEKIKLSSTVIAKGCAHTLTEDKIVKSSFNKNKATIKKKYSSNQYLNTRVCQTHKMAPM